MALYMTEGGRVEEETGAVEDTERDRGVDKEGEEVTDMGLKAEEPTAQRGRVGRLRENKGAMELVEGAIAEVVVVVG